MLHEINLHANRIVLVACGGAAVINLPGWIYALNHLTKDIELEVVLTHSAERLVSKNALTTVLEKLHTQMQICSVTRGRFSIVTLLSGPTLLLLHLLHSTHFQNLRSSSQILSRPQF